MLLGFLVVNAATLTRAIAYADSFVKLHGQQIPPAVAAQWRMMRLELEHWRDALMKEGR